MLYVQNGSGEGKSPLHGAALLVTKAHVNFKYQKELMFQ